MSVLSRLKTGVRVGDSVLDDILEDFSLYLRVEKRIRGSNEELLLFCRKILEMD